MIADSNLASQVIAGASGVLIAAITVGVPLVISNRRSNSRGNAKILDSLDTSNGHSIGEGMANVESRLADHDRRLTSLQVGQGDMGSRINAVDARLQSVANLMREHADKDADATS